MSTGIRINPGGTDDPPFLVLDLISDDAQASFFLLDITSDRLRSLADELDKHNSERMNPLEAAS